MSDNSAPLAAADSFIQQIDRLQEELTKQLPGYEHSVREIHRKLSDDPALLHILKPEQIGTIVQALKFKTNTVIAEDVVKKRTGGKRAKEITEDDI